jgi:hypothetical protein
MPPLREFRELWAVSPAISLDLVSARNAGNVLFDKLRLLNAEAGLIGRPVKTTSFRRPAPAVL